MLNDGFGDSLRPEEVVANFEKYAHKIAYENHWSRNNHDDLVQEALIEVWEASVRVPDASAVYYAKAVKGRLFAVGRQGRPWTGGDSKPGPKSRPIENQIDWQDPEVEDIFGSLLEATDLVSGVEWAYHHGEFMEALCGLSEDDREYVVRRFWHGQTDTEIAAIRGVTNKALGNRWTRTIQPKLQAALAHMAP